MTSVSYHIASLLEKMTSSDKDFRFMATNDLIAELQKDSIKLDDDSERKVVRMVLKLLEDKNGEVQNLAVKCLGPLVNKVKESQVETVVDTLCNNMLDKSEQLRDISSIGLKTVISDLSPSSTALATNMCKKIAGRLTTAIAKQDDVSVQLEALDILGDVLSRFGNLLVPFHQSIQQALLPQLSSARLAVRKRALIALGHLVVSCSKAIFVEILQFLIGELERNSSLSTTRTYVQSITAISRQTSHSVSGHIDRIVTLLVKFCSVDDDELREYSLQAFETLVRRCPQETLPHIGTVIKIGLKYLTHDPNYNYDDDSGGDEAMETEDDEQGDDNDEYSDDDDMSWKVRRASAKCIEAVIATRREMVTDFYQQISPALIARFREREENVKADIFHAYIVLLKQTRPIVAAVEPDRMEEEGGSLSMLQAQVSTMVQSLHRQLREKSIKTRQGCFALLTELVIVMPGALNDHLHLIVPGILFSLGDKNSSSNMKIDTLSFINVVVCNHQPRFFHQHIPTLLPAVIAAVNDPFYKITSEALLVLQNLVKVIRPFNEEGSFDYRPYVKDLYSCTLKKLMATDIDQEVKERAISCMGQIIYQLGDCLVNDLNTCLPILLDRLKNEITRLTTVKVLSLISSSPLGINLKPILNDAIPILSTFLRKNYRGLRLSALHCLNSLVRHYGANLNPATMNEIIKELPALLTESDLHVSQLTMVLLTSICISSPTSLGAINDGILPQIVVLVKSPLLQGSALNALLELLQALVGSGIPGTGFEELVRLVMQPVYEHGGQTSTGLAVHKQAFHSIAKCIAALSLKNQPIVPKMIEKLGADIRNPNSTDSVRLVSLLTVGEIGRFVDMSSQPEIENSIMQCFSSSNEEVKAAASYALGNVSVGNLPKFVPFVLQEIERQPKRQYLLLHALKEIINCQSTSPNAVEALKPHVLSIWQLLMRNCECAEEGTRNVVAECLGRLTLTNPADLLPRLRATVTSPSPLTRSTIITAVKFTISDQAQPIDVQLRAVMGEFLQALHDSDMNVRRVALVTFNSAAHNKPMLVRDLLGQVLPLLYDETQVRKELIREVEMGPFKHTVDDGLDIRKAAFECMYTLLDTCLDRIDVFEFLRHVEDGLNDHYDIKMLTYLMVIRLAHLAPSAVIQQLEKILEPLRATCLAKVKANSVKQEYEKQDELKRSALRAVNALLEIPDVDKSPQINDFLNQIKSSPELAALFESVQKDVSLAATEVTLMDMS